jgi:hypothetical protein
VWWKETAQERVELCTLRAVYLPVAADQGAVNFMGAIVPGRPADRARGWFAHFFCLCVMSPSRYANARIKIMSGPKSSAERKKNSFQIARFNWTVHTNGYHAVMLPSHKNISVHNPDATVIYFSFQRSIIWNLFACNVSWSFWFWSGLF